MFLTQHVDRDQMSSEETRDQWVVKEVNLELIYRPKLENKA